ncbi:uncharacterized protein TNCV_61731 [Trichonephila clavipes]|nr:uncharacterized protein TNCV_61731 [Trichonephila clavipes]
MSQRVEDFEKKLLSCRNPKKSKFVPTSPVPVGASPVPLIASPVPVKLSLNEGKTNWDYLNLNSLYNALHLGFGQKYSKDYAYLQMRTRLQKTRESLQEYASKIEEHTNLAFSDYPANVQETIYLRYFVD